MVTLRLPWLISLVILLGLLACTNQDQKSPTLRVANNEAVAMSFDHAKQLLERGENVEAISAFRMLLRHDGASVPVLNGLAIAHAELGRPDLAAGLFAQALAISPDDPTTLNNIGFAALRRKDAGLALSYLMKAQEHGDNAPEVRGNLALLQRLEARSNLAATEPARSLVTSVDKTFKLQRKNVSTIKLSGIKTTSDTQATISASVSPLSSATLIDFNELFDPWSANPMDKSSL